MKKRIISLMLTTVMTLGLTACGSSGDSHTTVTIEGNKYNLSGDFQDVVGNIVKNGIHVCSTGAQANLTRMVIFKQLKINWQYLMKNLFWQWSREDRVYIMMNR